MANFVAFHINFIHWMEEMEKRRAYKHRFRSLRDHNNPFTIPEEQFRKLYRLPSVIVRDELLPLIEPHIREGVRCTYVPTHIKVLGTLHLLAQGTYQSSLGKDVHISVAQSTASKMINEVIEIIAFHIFPQLVKFPTAQEDVTAVKNGFLEKFNFPNVIGAIDCSHIAVIAPPSQDPLHPALAYYNRKGYYSINVQTICDSSLKILAINARFPGATHDAAIWTSSNVNRYLRSRFERGDVNTWLLGDSGYPLTPWVMTPVPNAPLADSPEGRYNARQIRARNTIERCFGKLKQRFRCLLKHRVLHYRHRKAGLIVYACAALHNMLIERNIEYEDDDEDEEEEREDDDDDENEALVDNVQRDVLAAGRRTRNRLIEMFNV